MKIKIAWIGKTKEPAITSLTEEYLKRISRYAQVEGVSLAGDEALLETCGRSCEDQRRFEVDVGPDGFARKEFSSEQFAKFLGDDQDRIRYLLIFAIGRVEHGFGQKLREALRSIRFHSGR